MNVQRLREAGIDYQRGLSRFMGDRQLYETVLASFLEDTCMGNAQRALETGDRETLFSCAHELKGSCGNVDMVEVYKAACVLVELLRAAPYEADETEVRTAFQSMLEVYSLAQSGIRAAMED